MIRAVAVLSLAGLLVLVLYVPTAHPPTRFLEQLRAEHEAAIAIWGKDTAHRLLDRAIRMQSAAAAASPLPSERALPDAEGAVAQEMAQLGQRLLRNPYFRAVDALLMLASYRLAGLLEWSAWLLPLVVAAIVDGVVVRIVRSREFRHHDPERFGVWCALLILTGCGTVLACAWPRMLHPIALAAMPVAMACLLGLAIASFHRRA